MSRIAKISIGEFLDTTNEYNYNHLIIKSHSGETVYEAYGDTLIPIADHLTDNCEELINAPLDFFNVFAKDKFNITLMIYMKCRTREEERCGEVSKVTPFDFRKGA